MSSITLLLLLCLSMHACNARCLGIFLEDKQCHFFNKDAGEAKLHKTQIHPIGLLGNSVLLTEVQKEIGGNTMKEEESKAAVLKEEAISKSGTSGDHTVIPSQSDLQRLAKTESSQAQAQGRSLLGSSPDDTDEAVDSKENDFVADTVVMDYAQPHRKPPIHNEKP